MGLIMRLGGVYETRGDSLESENARLKKMLAESMLEIEVTREALRKKW